jgi:hypothetical protein
MTKTFFIIFFFILTSCKNNDANNLKLTKNKIIEKFNIEEFQKNQINGKYEIFYKNETGKKRYKTETGYHEDKLFYSLVFNECKSFYENGNLEKKGIRFMNEGFKYGVWKYYDVSGTKMKEVDYDKPFIKFPWQKIREYLVLKNISVESSTIENISNEKGTFWIIKNHENGIKELKIDGETGKIIMESK